MPLSIYQLAVPPIVKALTNLRAVLEKAKAHAAARKIDESAFISARLYPDMLPLSAQIQIASDSAKGAACRLAGVPIVAFEDNEKTLGDLKGRVEKTIDLLKTFKPEQIDGSEEKELVIKVGGKDTPFRGMQLLLGRSIPNFYFHVTTTYDILRHNGVDIGKRDFLGPA